MIINVDIQRVLSRQHVQIAIPLIRSQVQVLIIKLHQMDLNYWDLI